MHLTPLDIKKQEFKKTIRGFDPLEVESFLEMVAEEFENIIREKNNLADEVLKLKTQLQDYKDVEKNLQETLMTAQQTINDSKENSKREAEMLIREAELKSEKILHDSQLKLAELKNDLVVVKAQKDSIARRLKHLLESQLELIEVLELDDLGFDKFEDKRLIRKSRSIKEKEKIEFSGIDEVIPDENTPDQEVSGEVQTEEPNHSVSETNPKPSEDEIKRDENQDQDQRSRISDELIF